EEADGCDLPAPIARLTPMTAGIQKISDAERRARIEKARRLMAEHQIDALVLEPGSSLFYFTGVQWGLSERPFVAVIPAKGELAYVTPGFEEARDRAVGTGRVGVEERVRFFVVDGVHKELPQATFVEAVPVTAGCRMIKSPAELALMQRANDVTLAAYKAAFATLHEGMTQFEFQ